MIPAVWKHLRGPATLVKGLTDSKDWEWVDRAGMEGRVELGLDPLLLGDRWTAACVTGCGE